MRFTSRILPAAGALALAAVTAGAVFQRLENRAAIFPRVGKNGAAEVAGGAFVMGSREGGPDAEPHRETVNDFRIGRCEVTVAEYCDYLNDAAPAAVPPGIVLRHGRYRPARGRARRPVTGVSVDDAAAYCRWLSERSGEAVRLPTEAEWEFAARGGIPGARYPWGWGEPRGRACFAAGRPRRIASYGPNPFGLYDMAGNVFEWCAPADGAAAEGVARGGSWAETDPRQLCVFRRARFRRDYRDADVGFRVVIEPPRDRLAVRE